MTGARERVGRSTVVEATQRCDGDWILFTDGVNQGAHIAIKADDAEEVRA